MSDNYRKERIERLLNELQYEITRGIYERDIDPELGFRFMVALPKSGEAISYEFRSYPGYACEPRIKLVDG